MNSKMDRRRYLEHGLVVSVLRELLAGGVQVAAERQHALHRRAAAALRVCAHALSARGELCRRAAAR